jgi:WD40 repeat protein
METPSIFELTIQSTVKGGSYRVVAEWTRPGELPVRREHTVQLEVEPLQQQVGAASYGVALGRMVFCAGIRELFAQARVAGLLRVLLAVEAKELQSLRWERLAGPVDSDAWQRLGQSQRTPFSLYLPSISDRRFPPFGRSELKALVVVANPAADNRYGLRPFDEAHAIDTVLEGLGDIPSRVLGKDPRSAGRPTLTEICRHLTAERYTLMHVVSHGAFSSSTGETAVFLDDRDGAPVAVKAASIIETLRGLGAAHGLPHLAFLGVCESAKPEAEGALGGLGQRLVRELGMPAVVAMTERISQRTALTLGMEFYGRLREHGEVDLALVEACVAVLDHQDATVPALFSRLAGRSLFAEASDRALTPVQLSAVVERLDALFAERAPTLREHVRTVAEAAAASSISPSREAQLQLERRLAELGHLCDGVLETSFSALARGQQPPPYAVRCPFPGLQAFTAADREFFCGRAALVRSLLVRLEQRPFLAVLGNSGCGKSSLIMAGLLPRLRDLTPTLEIAQMRPGQHPLAELERALAGLAGAVRGVLYVDQFEEAFTLCDDEVERREFFDRLLEVAAPALRIIMSMRADFVGDCAEHEGLREQVEGLKLIPAMSPDELRRAIEEQGKAAGLRYETGLCELILEDIAKEPGAMPLLQHALRELYARRHGRWLRVDAYEELGRVQSAITHTAEGVWKSLGHEDRQRLRAVMLELTELHGTQLEGSTRHLRRRVRLEDLYFSRAAEGPSIRGLVDRLANDRLLVKSRDELGHDVVEVAHEALLRGWDRLQTWLADARDAIHLRQELEAAAAAWYRNPDSRSYLEHVHERGELVRSFLRNGALRLGPQLKAYFDACEQEEQRQAREQERQISELRRARDEAVAQRDRARDAMWMAYAKAFKDKDPTRALLGLREVRAKDTVGWLQDAIDVLQQPVARALLMGHEEAVTSASFSMDGRRIVTISSDGTARVWDADGRQAELVIRGHQGEVRSASFDGDAQRIVTTASDGTARVWSADESGIALELRGHDKHVVSASFSPDGTRVVTASRDKTARVWNADGSGTSIVLRGHMGHVMSASFSPDGARVVTASRDGTARVWSADGSGLAVVLTGHTGHVVSASFSPDGRRVVTASRDKTARVWNADGSGEVVVLRGHDEQVRSASFSRDGRYVLTVSRDRTARVWTVDADRFPVILRGQRDGIQAASFGPDGRRVVTASRDGTARIWHAEGGEAPVVLRGHDDEVVATSFSPDGRYVVTVSRDRTARVWAVDADQFPVILRGHREGIQAASFGPDGRRVVTASRDGTARVWNAEGGEAPVVLRGHEGWVVSASISPEGNQVVTAAADGTVRIWSVDGRSVQTILCGHEDEMISAVFSPDGRRVVVALADGTARVWAPDGPLVVLHGHAGAVASAVFSPDGRRIATASADGTARIWDAGGCGDPCVLRGHESGVTSVMFSPDGQHVVTASRDMTAQIWSADGRGRPLVLRGHEDEVISAQFDPASQRVVTASRDRTACIWHVDGSGSPLVFRGHKYLVGSARFSPGGQQIITASYDSTAMVWSADGQGSPLVLRGHQMGVVTASFSPDGRYVVTASSDGKARVWALDPTVVQGLLEATSLAVVPLMDRVQYLGECHEE